MRAFPCQGFVCSIQPASFQSSLGFMINSLKIDGTIAALAILVISPSFCAQTTPKPAYDFSLPRDERIKLAESAARPELSGKATVYLLEKTGYVKVRDGANGFSCFV